MTPEWIKRAKPGDKVVCVRLPKRTVWMNGSPARHEQHLRIGDVYTIRKVVCDEAYRYGIGFFFGIRSEAGNRLFHGANFFRPIQKHSTEAGMAMLKSLLHGAPVQETERA